MVYWREIEVESVFINEDNDQIVITGTPNDDTNEETGHNCDTMGCNPIEHIIIRANVTSNGL